MLQGASAAWKMPVAFIGVIVLPLGANAAEHASAIMFAMKDKLVSFHQLLYFIKNIFFTLIIIIIIIFPTLQDISLAVAIGSSTQLSMFLVSTIWMRLNSYLELLLA